MTPWCRRNQTFSALKPQRPRNPGLGQRSPPSCFPNVLLSVSLAIDAQLTKTSMACQYSLHTLAKTYQHSQPFFQLAAQRLKCHCPFIKRRIQRAIGMVEQTKKTPHELAHSHRHSDRVWLFTRVSVQHACSHVKADEHNRKQAIPHEQRIK